MTCSSGQKIKLVSIAAISVFLVAGCGGASPAVKRVYFNPYPTNRTVAVAVFMNHSGSADVDMLAVTDGFYSELQEIEGIEVVTVNVTRAALAELNLENVRHSADAMALAGKLQVDGVIVGAITRYDPYDPPELAMVVELYWPDADKKEVSQDATSARDLALAGKEEQFELSQAVQMRPVQRVVRLFDADKHEVVDRLKSYAKQRSGESKPYGWERYKMRMNYPRFVSHEVIGEMLSLEWQRQSRLRWQRGDEDRDY